MEKHAMSLCEEVHEQGQMLNVHATELDRREADEAARAKVGHNSDGNREPGVIGEGV